MSEPKRIGVDAARQEVRGGKALLICGYEEPEKCAPMHLEGAISMQELRSRLPKLSKDQELIFY